MENLLKYSQLRISKTSLKFVRYLHQQIEWNDRLIGITGARGTGKTTLMLQQIKMKFAHSNKAIYISLDDFYFTRNRLFEMAEDFYLRGGRYLFIDEVHKYPEWAIDLKNLYDIYVDLNIIFSGSSAIQLHQAKADLSRRAAMYHLHELSFREYLELKQGIVVETFGLDDLLKHHILLASNINRLHFVLPMFKEYLEKGVYPFFKEAKGQFYERLISTINTVIENDLMAIDNINYQTSYKLRKLISVIADSVPFKVNISELSRKTTLSRDVLLRLLKTLDEANLLKRIMQEGAPTGHLTKPDKIYLNNSTLLYALHSNQNLAVGTVRETFFMNQLIKDHDILTPKNGDFLIDHQFTFEIGGRGKTKKQIAGLENAFLAVDDTEVGYENKIPLWLFGFLY
jgi:predicted AAA+ superfamily ATPase